MASLHQLSGAANGSDHMLVERVTVERQIPPRISRNDKPYSIVILKSAGTEMMLSLWEAAAKWKLPLNTELTLRGKFQKEDYQGKPSLRCEELQAPDGSTEFAPEEVQAAAVKPSIRNCLDAGLRAADYMVTKKRPELASAAFAFAAQALLDGVRLE